ncbi:hypothetical protein L7F22_049053 [Adiantum nelumboides]|nr:hypothetical protein [Adiantum nelumboides]
MQAQDVNPQAASGLGVPTEQAGPVGTEEQADHGHKKKSVMGKVKDKAKKLKTKMKKPKSPGATGESNNDGSSSGSSSDEEESGSDPHQQQLDKQPGNERDVVVEPGLKGAAFDAVPDPNVDTGAGVHERLGQLRLGDEPDSTKLQQGVPSAPGQVSAGVTPYLATHDVSRGIPVEGKNSEGKDLFVSDDKGVKPMDYEQPSDVSKTSDNTGAWYTPTSADSEQKPLKDRVVEGATAAKDTVAATATSGAGALGLKSPAETENVEGGAPKTTLEQAKERVLGSSSQSSETGETKPSITGRAAGTVTGLKDTIASKLGYGSNKNLTGKIDAPLDTPPTSQVDAQNPEGKSYLQMIQERAAGATAAVSSKLGYGEKQSPTGDRSLPEVVSDKVKPADDKSYAQKATEAAYGAKDAVADKLGYGAAATKDSLAPATESDGKSYVQKAQETAAGAKDAVASKLGYGNTDIPVGATESAYGKDQNVPASTAARFHPGEEDRALSELITEKMSTGAATVRETLMKPFGSKSGPPTPTTTPPPSSAAAVEADPVHTTVLGTNPDVPQDQKPGIVGKVTGAVSSLLGTSPSGKKKAEEAAGKAVEDTQAQTPGVGTY